MSIINSFEKLFCIVAQINEARIRIMGTNQFLMLGLYPVLDIDENNAIGRK